MNGYKVVKTNKWYDPEGLNIQRDGVTIFEGNERECQDFLRTKRDELRNEYADRNDIHIYPIKTQYKLERLEPFYGGYMQIWSDEVLSVYFEVYFMSAISKDIYQMVKA